MPQPATQQRTDALDYIQAMLRELREIAQAERCDMLTYLIEMAYVEASDIIRGERPMRVKPSMPLTKRTRMSSGEPPPRLLAERHGAAKNVSWARARGAPGGSYARRRRARGRSTAAPGAASG